MEIDNDGKERSRRVFVRSWVRGREGKGMGAKGDSWELLIWKGGEGEGEDGR